jgi:anti-sigma B factor antagonist
VTTPPPFELHTSRAADVLVLRVSGELDLATAPQLAEAIDAATDTVDRVVVDLSSASFLDSSALNVLVHARRSLGERDIPLRVVSPTDRSVRRVLEITHLTGELGVVETLDDALTRA